MTYFCCDERRRGALGPASVNGIDYVEVSGRDLLVFFVNDRKVGTLGPENFAIDRGDRIRGLRVTAAAPEPGETHVLRVTASELGDFSRYTLRLVAGDDTGRTSRGVRPGAVIGRLLVPDRLPVRFRLPDVARLPAGTAR